MVYCHAGILHGSTICSRASTNCSTVLSLEAPDCPCGPAERLSSEFSDPDWRVNAYLPAWTPEQSPYR